MKNQLIFLAYILLTAVMPVKAQTEPFYNDIQSFKEQDSTAFPPKHAILFVGSSSFTKWKDVQSYFPDYPIVNRGFGGSSLPDVIHFANDIIIPYLPKQIVIYCGENDLAGSDTTVNGKVVFNRFKQLFTLIRQQLPTVSIAYVSMKPSPSRKHLWPKMTAGNTLIKKFLAKQKKTAFIDVYHKMFNADGTVMNDIFLEDNLHMNAKGYAIWQKAIAPFLLK
ncbi:GDSL-type esterase/lipase family protein [Ferruginibacter paludis]|uniref:GDSL-type esterase/lipase family protein n=1 Tax=Ferruginibacter paludis TaxID=1310417 RepID=UPI0025B30439|nr:GDSL-type esterase/lipase family protein [Ferruginibacter paludis]MDN3657737.1 GDSL-type esterase/lipase family protein [Ferruginibacter paludis]